MKCFILLFLFLSAGFIYAEDIKMIVPYLGTINSEYKNSEYNINEKDSALMKGVYLQWIRPGSFLVNAFNYGADDLYNENLRGLHFIGDYYIPHPQNGRYAIGAGLELIKPDADITITEPPVTTEVNVKNSITVPFIRAGRYFVFDLGKSSTFSIFHWAGYQLAVSRGEVNVFVDKPLFMGGPEEFDEKIKTETGSALTGIKLGINIMRFIDLDFKYSAAFNSRDFFNTVEGMGNFYFTRNIGFSGRHKYTESESGKMDYTIYGVIISF